MSMTDDIRDAVISNLKSYTGWRGNRPREISKVPSLVSEVRKPAIFMIPGPGGASTVETLGASSRQGDATQQFQLMLVVDTDDGIDVLDTFLDDVRNCLERSLSQGNTLCSIVRDVVVTGWTEVLVGEGMSNGTYLREVTVDLSYDYTRGSL